MRIFLLLLLLTGGFISAQVAPPDFLCTRSSGGADSLRWENVTATCGAFQATEIYRSPDENSPFTLLTEINDPSVTEYRDENPNGELRFYYLRYRYDCPGVTAENSDTLNNLIPATPAFRYISIEDGDLVLNWAPSSSPEVSGYIVIEVTPTDIIPIGSTGQETTFRISDVPNDELTSRQYRIAAVDACGNDSPQGAILSAANLTGTGGDGCTSDVTLTVDQATLSTYQTLTSLELFVSTNGGPFVGQGTVGPQVTTIDYAGGNDGDELCFYVVATPVNGAGSARSAVYCQTITISQPVRDFAVYGVETLDDGTYRFQLEDSGNQPTNITAELQQRIGANEWSGVELPGTIFQGGEYIAPAVGDQGNTAPLRLRVTDDCGRTFNSNAVQPVVFRARTGLGGQNLLSWTDFVNGLEGTVTYDILRVGANGELMPLAQGLTQNTYTDNDALADGPSCYRVRANFVPATAGNAATFGFLSNEACAAPTPELFMPNAFSPTATRDENRTIRPRFSVLPNNADYNFSIYNRWGNLVFFSDDPAEGWDGDWGGQSATAGAYIFVLVYNLPSGVPVKRSGTINLIR